MSNSGQSPRDFCIGSRKSDLAMVQTHWVRDRLKESFPDHEFAIDAIATKGDKILDVALSKIGDKGLFTKELEVGLVEEKIDLAVHSLKDMPTKLPEGLTLGCITKRENPADALVLHAKHAGKTLQDLEPGTVIGTSSLRRLSQLRHHFPHLEFKDVRGNLNTRLAKLDNGEYDALILAVAGLQRLGFGDRVSQVIPQELSLYAVGQGALTIECRENDTELLSMLKVLEDIPTRDRCLAERAFLRSLEGGCQVPIGVDSAIEGDQLTLTGMVASLDGKTLIKDTVSGSCDQAESIGQELAEILKGKGADVILQEIFALNRS
ncbi:MAG: hydroxymethylbilane synthase [Synechococcaceae cyanobacterium RL_1_2]|nr:hydroxymethylbilane synthase [Synechococcaceae cyanobacterium RL_1_2]